MILASGAGSIVNLVHFVNSVLDTVRESIRTNKGKRASQGKQHSKYRLIEIIRSEAQESYCLVRVIGTRHIMKASPVEITADNSFINGFSVQGLSSILNLAHTEAVQPKYQILSIDFDDIWTVTIKERSGSQRLVKLQESEEMKDILLGMKPLDAYKLGKFLADEML